MNPMSTTSHDINPNHKELTVNLTATQMDFVYSMQSLFRTTKHNPTLRNLIGASPDLTIQLCKKLPGFWCVMHKNNTLYSSLEFHQVQVWAQNNRQTLDNIPDHCVKFRKITPKFQNNTTYLEIPCKLGRLSNNVPDNVVRIKVPT